MAKQKLMVTSALPYANGPIHLGHVAGAYLPADIYVRFNRLLGNDIVYICGTDEHGVPITLKAEQENVTPRIIVKRYHQDIKKAFAGLNIVFDNFSGTSNIHNKHHARLARDFFINLLNNDLVVSRLADQHYCRKCERFLPDRFIQGICPKCGYTEARGDECPQCSQQYDPAELQQTKCKICSSTPEMETTKHWYLRLDVMQQEISEWIDTKDYWKENVVSFVKGWFKQGLKERAITRDLYWGVPVPLEEAPGKVLYVWFDAPIGYISSTMEWAENQGDLEKWRDYWQNPDCKIIHFIGKDNIPFHAIIWPAMLAGQRRNYQLPWHIPANEYLNFGIASEDKAEKGSTSKGNVIWVHDALAAFPADMLRYYLAACAPEKNDTLFTWHDFQQKCNSELLGIIGNFANRVLKFIANNFESVVPDSGPQSDRDQEVLAAIAQSVDKVSSHYQKFEVRNAIAEIVALARCGNQYFDEKAPWKSVKENPKDCATCLYTSIQMVKALAVMLFPIIPESCQKLWKQLGYNQALASWDQAREKLAPGQHLDSPSGLFTKIENSVITELENKLAQAIETPQIQAQAPPLKSETISFQQFLVMDIRIGEILEARKVPKTNKLLQLTVKIGPETRTLISGIADQYQPQDLIGKMVPVLVNLEPAKIKGIESKGMILCGDVNGKPILLHPDREVPPGTIVR